MQRTGNLQLVDIDRSNRLGGEQRQRIDPDDNRRFERPAALLRHLEEHVGMARQKQHAETVGPVQLAAVDGDVLSPRPRIAGDHQAGGNIRPAVVLVVSRKRKLLREIHVAMHHLVHRRRHRLAPWDGLKRRIAKAGENLAGFHSHRLSHPPPVGNESGGDRDRMPARVRKQRRPHAVEPLGDGGELEAQADAGREHHQPVACREVIEPLPQRADRLRGIVAVSARSLAAICVLERVAKLGHTGVPIPKFAIPSGTL